VSSVKIGNVEVVSILDQAFAFPYGAAYPGVPEAAWQPYKSIYPKCWNSEGAWATNAQVFLVRSGGQNVLVDMGLGPEQQGGPGGQLRANLEAAGVAPGDVNIVVFTHLHYDHAGWAVVGGQPFCPNARHLAPEADWAQVGNTGALFPAKGALDPIQSSGHLELTSGEKSVTPELTIIPTPGHTPGHQSLLIVSAGQRGIILGDVFNHPAQANETDWNAGFDFDQDLARQTRRRVMERLEQDGSVVASGHYPAPGFGRLVREGGRRIFKEL
jgi:glyoxylase-like metal-dependent hydrolase (beta-lactamase superfamily II)